MSIQAQACGIPIIATKGGPTDEFLCDQGSTIFVPSKLDRCPMIDEEGRQLCVSIEDLATCMIKAVNENQQLKAIAMNAGIEHVKNHFTWEHATDRLLEGLKALVAKNL